MADAGKPGGLKKSPGLTLADLGNAEGFGRQGKEDQLYAFQLADGVYKRKESIISSDGSTSMEANLDLGGNWIGNLADPAEPQEATTKGYVDSRIRVHQAVGIVAGSDREKSVWLDGLLRHGYKRRKLKIARMPPGKTIYNRKIVLLNLWIGLAPSQHIGNKKIAEFSIFSRTKGYYHFLKFAEESSHPAKGLVFIQEDDEDEEEDEQLSLYHD